MACYYPRTAWQREGGGKIIFHETADNLRRFTIPCGQCIGCRLERSRQWAIRCLHESQCHWRNCFITLTYDDVHLPKDGQLVYRHFQKFVRSLRKKCGRFRYYMCGEYGEQSWRPHFHACLFGIDFADRKFYKNLGSGFNLYTSELLSSIWTRGFASVGDVSFESAAYIARYVCKKVTGKMAEAHYRRINLETGEIYQLVPEFTRMSLKPGIGKPWFDKWRADVYPHDYVIIDGKEVKPPRYYDRLLALVDMKSAGDVDVERFEKALSTVDDCTVERLRARETVTRARLKFKCRSLE